MHISVTQAEAQTRADLLDVHSYAVDLDLTRGAEVFGSTTVVRFACTSPGAAAFVEVRPVNLRSAVLNGRPLDPASLAGGRLTLDGLEAENELRVEADMGYTTTGEGMHRFTDPADGEVYVYTQCGPDEGPRVFACFDQPDLKSVFEVSVTAPEGWTVLSNGPGEFRDGRWRFEPTQPISTYLAVVVGGPLHSVRAEHDGIPLGLHCRRSLAPHLDAEDILDITRRCFDRYHQLFDQRYPFGKYDQVFVPEFNWGAVENPGCVTFRDDFLFRSAVTDAEREIRAVVIAHEMAHMWFGDLVTMRWWDDLWLNESFAEYMGHQVIADATRFTGPWTGFASSRKPWGYDADQRGSTHPIAAQRIDDAASALVNFDGISYAKGAAALRQLVAWVGADAFFAGVNDHFARHAFGNAGLADLVDALTRASGRDVQGWTERWLRTSGVDMLRCSDAGIEHTGEPRRPHRIQVGAYDLSNGRLTLRERVEVDLDDSPTMPLPFERPDLLVLNDSDLTYAKVRLDERSWQSVTEALSTIDDELTRAVLWSTARDLVRDAELPPSDYLTLAEAHLPAEPAVAIVEAVLTFTLHLIDRYLPPDRRPAAATTLAGICRKIVYAEGVRLAAGRALIDSTQDLEELQESLRTATLPGGLEVDQELRWKTLLRLSAAGLTGEPDIAAELEQDTSATGLLNAGRCRAAVPDPAAKEQAWERLFTDDDLSIPLLTAIADGFWQPAQHELTEGFVGRYFERVPSVGGRGPAAARVFGQALFPKSAATPETVGLAESCLDREDLAPPLRRALADQLDDLRRATRIRAATPKM